MLPFYRNYKLSFLIIVFIFLLGPLKAQGPLILLNGHSHNDYTRDRPLYDALKYGFTSIEVDVFLNEGKMVVTHDDTLLNEKPTIQQLYLDPLKSIIHNNQGKVFQHSDAQLVLMVDLKSEKVSTYKALKEIFSQYLDIIEWYQSEKVIVGPIKVLLSGGPPIDIIKKESDRYFYVDGAIDQWDKDYPVNFMPRASTNYTNHFKWFGNGKMPADEQEKLRELIGLAHANGRKVRFWGAPNRVEVWRKLLDEGADWINVDDLKGFYEFYSSWVIEN